MFIFRYKESAASQQNTLALAGPEYVFARLNGVVRNAGVRLERVGDNGKHSPLAMLNLEELRVGALKRPTSSAITGSLERIVVTDCVTPDPFFPQIVDSLTPNTKEFKREQVM